MKEIEFKKWIDIDHLQWKFNSKELPIGQKWGMDNGKFITNHRGEGFSIHGGTKYSDKCKIIDALNRRDAEIAKLKNKLEDR